MKKFIVVFLVAFLVSIVFLRCNKTDLTASYIEITPESFVVDMTDYNRIHGTNYDAEELAAIASQKFSDAWIFVNGKDLGTWELPCKIPILATDSTDIQIFPGIKMNGISTSRPRYPFVQGTTLKLGLKAGTVLSVPEISVKYFNETIMELVENFEPDYNQYFESTDSTGVSFERIDDPANQGNRIGVINLEDSVDNFEIVSTPLLFNYVPSSVFLEFDYRSDSEEIQNFYVGTLIETSTSSVPTHEPLVVVNTSTQWKKIYINLTQSVLRNQLTATSYRVILSGGKSGTNDIHLYFDNIKVVYL